MRYMDDIVDLEIEKIDAILAKLKSHFQYANKKNY